MSKTSGSSTAREAEPLRDRNLEAFEKYQPAIHARLLDHVPVSRLEVDEDGVADTVFNDQYFYNKKTEQYVADQLRTFWQNPRRRSLKPPTPDNLGDAHFVKRTRKFLHNLLLRSTELGMEFAQRPVTEETYFLLIFGVGLGGHIDPLVERVNCHVLILVEPNLEFIYHSLEVYDWAALFERFEERNGKVKILVDSNPDSLARGIRDTLRSSNPCSVDGMHVFSHYNNAVFDQTSQFVMRDRDFILAALGSMDDEIMMIKNAHASLYPGTAQVYLRPSASPVGLPVFVVGSGPSLDRDIPFLKKNADKAIILSCGSAIRPLLVNGIVPDFLIEVENLDVYRQIEQVAEAHDISDVTLLCSVTCERDALEFFDNIVFFMRASLSPYPIWHLSEEQTLRNCNPTVSNAGLSFAQEIGSNEIYLFGVDMGSMDTDPEVHHSKDAYYYTEGAVISTYFEEDIIHTIPVPGNFGGNCHTSHGLFMARDYLSRAMKANTIGRQYFNCSNGAAIEGALAKSSRSIKLEAIDGGKRQVVEDLIERFPVYSAETFDGFWQDEVMVERMEKFIDLVREKVDAPEDFSDKKYLSDLMSILRGPLERKRFAMAALFRGSIFMSLLTFDYYRKRLTDRDRVRELDAIAREELHNLLDKLLEVAVRETGTLSADAGPREMPADKPA